MCPQQFLLYSNFYVRSLKAKNCIQFLHKTCVVHKFLSAVRPYTIIRLAFFHSLTLELYSECLSDQYNLRTIVNNNMINKLSRLVPYFCHIGIIRELLFLNRE